MTLRERYDRLKHHLGQQLYWLSEKRFNLNHSGRRSGKSEIAKRRLVRKAIAPSPHREPRFAALAPVFRQAKAIFWNDLKRMVPKEAVRGKVSESTLTIPLWHGGELFVAGMDNADRIEGSPIDHALLDEFGNMKPSVWAENLRPALSTLGREGSADFIGVPEGRNHYYLLAQIAKAEALDPDGEWGYHHWPSWEILAAKEIESARRLLDALTYDQEFGGEFVLFSGRAYYGFGAYSVARLRDRYDPTKPIGLCLDFNVSPGVAAVVQEMPLPVEGESPEPVGTAVIGEVHIPDNSTTPAVVRRFCEEWSEHTGLVNVYGDATGGSRGTAQTEGSDWDIVEKDVVHGGDGFSGFGDRVTFNVPLSNPTERARLNAVNSRLRSSAGLVRLMVDPIECPNVILDLEGVITLAGGSGEIDKKKFKKLSHISDALGYYVEHEFPTTSKEWSPLIVTY